MPVLFSPISMRSRRTLVGLPAPMQDRPVFDEVMVKPSMVTLAPVSTVTATPLE